jgi:hypothetical protein
VTRRAIYATVSVTLAIAGLAQRAAFMGHLGLSGPIAGLVIGVLVVAALVASLDLAARTLTYRPVPAPSRWLVAAAGAIAMTPLFVPSPDWT